MIDLSCSMLLYEQLRKPRVCSRFSHARAGSSFCVGQGRRREICLLQMNDERRRPARKLTRPEGLHGKWPHAALQDLTRGTPLPTSRALPGTICQATRVRLKREQTLGQPCCPIHCRTGSSENLMNWHGFHTPFSCRTGSPSTPTQTPRLDETASLGCRCLCAGWRW